MSSNRPPEIGEPALRVDAYAKATGAQVYPSDFVMDDMVFVRVFRSPHPHARILSIDTIAAQNVPGVVRVITAADIPGEKNAGLFIPDQPVLCGEVVRRQGDAIALVVAESDDAARKGCDLIDVVYEPLPVVSDMLTAMDPETPRIHPDGNLLSELHFEVGDVNKAFETADQVYINDYLTGRQEHAFIEPEGGAAFYDEEGRLTVRLGGQYPHRDAQMIGSILGLQPDEVRAITPLVGGAFGGKLDVDVQCYLALATHLTKCPSRMVYDRDESILSGTKRHPAYAYYKTACNEDGEWVAAEVKVYIDTGAYASFGESVLTTVVDGLLGPYRVPNVKVDAYCVYTNNSYAGAFRGFGALQGTFGLEQQIDIMARAYGIDPIDYRKRHAIDMGEQAALGFKLETQYYFKQVLEAARTGPIYSQREQLVQLSGPENQWKKRGVGLAAAWMGVGYGHGVPDIAEVSVKLTETGRFELHVGGTDMGQGNATAHMQVTAHELNCGMGDIDLVLGDSLGPDSGSTDAARAVTFVGKAAMDAARDLYQQILAEVARELGCDPGDLTLEGGSVIIKETGQSRSLAGLGELIGKGSGEFPEGDFYHAWGIPSFMYTAGVQLALVEVDLLTGKVEVLKLENIFDAGKVINQQGIEGQSEGGIIQGLGYALLEDCIVTDGIMQNPNLSTYIIPSIGDVPYDIRTTPIEEPGHIGPYGAKGIAEMVLTPTAPAILNAVYDAIGERFTRVPLTPEAVLRRINDED
jgi:CO/xanthine dehydrogenase Mo-binding subunit